jgi:hypothetical protein
MNDPIGQEKEKEGKTYVINYVLTIKDATCHIFKMLEDGKVIENGPPKPPDGCRCPIQDKLAETI